MLIGTKKDGHVYLGTRDLEQLSCAVVTCSGEKRTVYTRERPDSVDNYGIGGRVVI